VSIVLGVTRPVAQAIIRSTLQPYGNAISYLFNGTDQYATHAAWSPLGDPEIYPPSFTFTTSNPDGFVVDTSSYPITEIGRVGTDYHSGTLRSLQYTDISPLQERSYYLASAVREIDFPDVTMEEGTISFLCKFDAVNQVMVDGSVPILSVSSAGLVGGANVTGIDVDFRTYQGVAIPDGRVINITIYVNGGTFNKLSGSCGYADLRVSTIGE